VFNKTSYSEQQAGVLKFQKQRLYSFILHHPIFGSYCLYQNLAHPINIAAIGYADVRLHPVFSTGDRVVNYPVLSNKRVGQRYHSMIKHLVYRYICQELRLRVIGLIGTFTLLQKRSFVLSWKDLA
jgi:hypothetical protein